MLPLHGPEASGKQKAKKTQQLNVRDTPRKGESRVLCPFHGLTARNESAAEGEEGATDLLSVFDQLLQLSINCSTVLLRTESLALQGANSVLLVVFTT